MNNVFVIGGGAWGTALAAATRRAGRDVVLYARETEVVNAINAGAPNPIYLPDVQLPDGLGAVSTIADAADDCDAVILVVPAQFVRATLKELAETLSPKVPIVLAAKGIEQGTLALMTEIAAEVVPNNPLAVISGPSFAGEVARGVPAAVTLACADDLLGRRLVNMIAGSTFRIYQSNDLIGADDELNVFANNDLIGYNLRKLYWFPFFFFNFGLDDYHGFFNRRLRDKLFNRCSWHTMNRISDKGLEF